jgi:peptide/nickel transport system substrate-binding protein
LENSTSSGGRPLARRDLLRGIGVGAVALGGGGLLAACGPSSTPAPAGSAAGSAAGSSTGSAQGGILQAAISGEPNFINPADALELTEYSVVRSVYDGLTQWNASYSDLEPALALSWSSNADATNWAFKLRPDVKFQDGTPFNSTAVKRSIQEYLPNAWGALFANLKTIDDSDPLTLNLVFSASNPDFARNQAFVKVISPKLLTAKQASSRAVGTGAFAWGSWAKGQKITLTANKDYWGKPAPRLGGLVLPIVTDETARVSGLESSSLDLIMQVDAHDLPSLKSASSLQTSPASTWLELNLTFRCDQPVTKDPRVRQAVAYGIDRAALVKNVLLGQGVVAPSPIPTGCYGHVTPTTAYSYNPSKARQLLKEAGYPNGISLNLSGGQPYALLGQAMVAQLAEAGVKVHFDIQESGVEVNDLIAKNPKHQLFIITYGWVNGGPFHFDTLNVINHPQYKGAALQSLINKANTTADGPQRLQALSDAQNLFMTELPHLPLYYAIDTDAFSGKVTGYATPKDTYQPVFARAAKQ